MVRSISKVILSVFAATSTIVGIVALPVEFARTQNVVSPIASQPQDTPAKVKEEKGISILFVNRTGSTLTSLQVSPAKARIWNFNILDKDLPDGQERSIKVSEGRSECRRNIRATFSNGSTIEDFDVDICKNDIYTFTVVGLW